MRVRCTAVCLLAASTATAATAAAEKPPTHVWKGAAKAAAVPVKVLGRAGKATHAYLAKAVRTSPTYSYSLIDEVRPAIICA
jgi:hypothetical protein